jgi:hypothetical protein
MKMSSLFLFIETIFNYIKIFFVKYKVDSQIYRSTNYIKLQAYDQGEIYDFYIPYCRHQRQNHKMRNIILISHQGDKHPIKLYPGCRLEFKASDLQGTHYVVETRDGELHDKDFLH